MDMTHYEVLGVPPNATRDQIKEAYRRLARLTHPDKGQNDDSFVDVDKAWKTLSNDDARKRYDAERMGRTYDDDAPVYARLRRSSLDFRDGMAEYPCRCGHLYSIDEVELHDVEMLVVPCDECSFVVTVTNEPSQKKV